jgi:hypothetical protein
MSCVTCLVWHVISCDGYFICNHSVNKFGTNWSFFWASASRPSHLITYGRSFFFWKGKSKSRNIMIEGSKLAIQWLIPSVRPYFCLYVHLSIRTPHVALLDFFGWHESDQGCRRWWLRGVRGVHRPANVKYLEATLYPQLYVLHAANPQLA